MIVRVSKWLLAVLLAFWVFSQISSAHSWAAGGNKNSKTAEGKQKPDARPAKGEVGLAKQERSGGVPKAKGGLARRGPELSVSLEAELEKMVLRAGELHSVLTTKNEKQIQVELKELSESIRRAIEASKSKNSREPSSAGMLPTNHRKYLTNMLSDMAKVLVKAQAPKARAVSLQEAYKQIVQIKKMYQVKATSYVFFCGKDKSVWVQKNSKPHNPFSDPSCARRVLK